LEKPLEVYPSLAASYGLHLMLWLRHSLLSRLVSGLRFQVQSRAVAYSPVAHEQGLSLLLLVDSAVDWRLRLHLESVLL
jgi:hypothetical protein